MITHAVHAMRASWQPRILGLWLSIPPLVLAANVLAGLSRWLDLLPLHGILFGALVVLTSPRVLHARLMATAWMVVGVVAWAVSYWALLWAADSPWRTLGSVGLHGTIPASVVLAGIVWTTTMWQLGSASDAAVPSAPR